MPIDTECRVCGSTLQLVPITGKARICYLCLDVAFHVLVGRTIQEAQDALTFKRVFDTHAEQFRAHKKEG